MNDVLLNKKKIKKFIGEHKRANKDRAYTHDEIKKLVDTGDFRFKALILLLAATGVRIGCIGGLLLKHLERRDDLDKVTVYENSNEAYHCFTTLEAAQAMDQYLDFRRRAGESLKPHSPLFRNDFNANAIAQVRKNSRPIDNDTFRNLLHNRLQKAGLIEKSDIITRRHHPVPMSQLFFV
jgi:integrase